MSAPSPNAPAPDRVRLRGAPARHPVAAFFLIAYAVSWLCWLPAALGAGGPLPELLVFVGVWGPATAGAAVTWARGESLGRWAVGLLAWRRPLRWYVYALGLPIAIVIVVSGSFVVLGQDLDGSLLGGRLAVYLPMLAFLTLAGGGNEEWGWRGFALPELLRRMSPVRATLLLGSLWAVWHLPLLAAQDDLSHGLDGPDLVLVLSATAVAIVAHAVLYTYLYQRTRSVLLCALLHGSFNAANGTLVLRTEIEGTAYATMQYCITVTMWTLAAALILTTRGRLGAPEDSPDKPDQATGFAGSPSEHGARRA